MNRAKKEGWCTGPGNCPGGKYYYGGIDYAVPNGTEIVAGFDGTVEVRKQPDGYGNHIRLKSADGHTLVYGHLRDMVVANGAKVKQGDLLGYTDNTGFSSGPHLHFELRNPAGKPIDPESYLVYKTGDDPEPEPEPEPGIILPTIPALPKLRVTKHVDDYLNVRTGPSTGDSAVSRVFPGDEFSVMEFAVRGEGKAKEIWAKIGHNQWVAMKHPSEENMLLEEKR